MARSGRAVVCPVCYGSPPVECVGSLVRLGEHVRMDSLQRCRGSRCLVEEARQTVAAREREHVRASGSRRRAEAS